MPKISIIVPVYKAEAVLATCVASILAQDFADFELLLVDDGSPDASGKLCDKFAAQDARVRVLHKENGGVSTARNLGMAQAAGEHVLFADSDDFLAENACSLLYAALEQAGADSAGCAHYNLQPSGEKEVQAGALPAGIYGPEELRRGIVDRLLGQRLGESGAVLNGFVWRFLFSREIIAGHDLRFVGAYLEDELFLMEYFCHAQKLAMVDEPLYYYLQNPASVTRNFLPHYMDTFRRFMEQKAALAAQYGIDSDDALWRESSQWAGLLIAIGNEFAPGNPAGFTEKRRHVASFAGEKEMAQAVRAIVPRGLGRNKQLVAFLVRRRWFYLLALLYRVKNRGK